MMITLLSGTYTFADLDWQSILGIWFILIRD